MAERRGSAISRRDLCPPAPLHLAAVRRRLCNLRLSGSLARAALTKTLRAITGCMSTPVRMIPFPPVKMADDDRRGYDPGSTSPINILAVANPYIFVPVPGIILGSVGHVSRWRRRLGCDSRRLNGNCWWRWCVYDTRRLSGHRRWRRRVTPRQHQRQRG